MSQSSYRRSKTRAFILGASALLVCAGLAAVAVVGIPVGWMVQHEIARIGPASAQSMEIGGARLKLFPPLTLVASEISITDRASERPIARVPRASIHLPFFELFSSNRRIRSVTLSGAKLFADHITAAALPLAAYFQPFQNDGMEVEKVIIEDGSIAVSASGAKQRVLVDKISAELRPSFNADPVFRAAVGIGSYTAQLTADRDQSGTRSAEVFPLNVTADIAQDQSPLMHAALRVTKDTVANLVSCRLMSATLKGEPFDGWATIDVSAKKPVIAVTAKFGKVAFDHLIISGAADQAGSPLSVLWETLRNDAADLSFQLSAAEFKGSLIKLSPVHLEGTLADRRLAVEVSQTEAYGGSLSSQVTVEDGGSVRSLFQLKGASMPLMMEAVDRSGTITGTFNADGSFETSANQSEPIRQLSGELAFAIEDGAIKTPRFLKILQTLLPNSQSQEIFNANGELPFSFLSGKIKIDRGVATSDNILFQSAIVRASGQGEADLKTQRIHFVFNPERASVNGSSRRWEKVGLPIEISGAVDDPKLSVDVGGAEVNSEKLNSLEAAGAELLGLSAGSRDQIHDAVKSFGEWLLDNEKDKSRK